ncbi:hypothetical protein [Nostoc sp.]|uniref:hypothetical protein n=1 Tax=Nostoc sp. TaxID=1180 RepID=UPI002FF76350
MILVLYQHCKPKQSHCQPMQEFAVATFFYSDGSSKSVSHRYSRTRSHFLSATRAFALVLF